MQLAPALLLPLADGEAPWSFCSRIAQRLTIPVALLAQHMGTTIRRIAEGQDDALESLAKATQTNADDLAAHAFTRLSKLRYRFKGEVLSREVLSLASVRFCPACLRESLSVGDGPILRTEWLIAPIGVCERHNVLLASLPKLPGQQSLHTAPLLLEAVDSTQAMQAIAAIPTPLEEHLLARLRGEVAPSWLRNMPFYAVASLSEAVGAGAKYGSRDYLANMAPQKRREAAAAGFDVLVAGETAIVDYLKSLDTKFHDTNRSWGIGQIYGGLFRWLSERTGDDPSYDEFRTVVREHIIDAYPVGPADLIFRKPVERRRTHSIKTMWKEFGIRPRHLRNLMLAEGLITHQTAAKTDDRILLPVSAAERLANSPVRTCSFREVQLILGSTVHQARTLTRSGLVPAANEYRNRKQRYLRVETEALRDALMARADPTRKNLIGFQIIDSAELLRCCTTLELLQLVLDGKLTRVGRANRHGGISSIAVDPMELKSVLLGEGRAGLTWAEVEKRLGITSKVRRYLTSIGVLPTFEAQNPVSKRKQDLVLHCHIIEFDQMYISLAHLAKTLGRNRWLVRCQLEAAGVNPAFDRDAVPARIYLRTQASQVYSEAAWRET